MSWLKKLTSGLRKSSEKVTQNLSSLSRLFGKEKIDAASLEELEDALIMADIGVSAATDIVAALKGNVEMRHKSLGLGYKLNDVV